MNIIFAQCQVSILVYLLIMQPCWNLTKKFGLAFPGTMITFLKEEVTDFASGFALFVMFLLLNSCQNKLLCWADFTPIVKSLTTQDIPGNVGTFFKFE